LKQPVSLQKEKEEEKEKVKQKEVRTTREFVKRKKRQ